MTPSTDVPCRRWPSADGSSVPSSTDAYRSASPPPNSIVPDSRNVRSSLKTSCVSTRVRRAVSSAARTPGATTVIRPLRRRVNVTCSTWRNLTADADTPLSMG